MTISDAHGPEPLISEILQGLDLAIVEWGLDQTYTPLSSTPRWFRGAVPWSSLPFLEHFVAEARRYLHDHLGGVIASDQFTVQNNMEELLLRARALKVEGRLVVVIERLEGAADLRPILREARQQALDHEALTERARSIHKPLDKVAHAIADLQQTSVSDEQRPVLEALSQAFTKLEEAAAVLQPPRQRR